MSRPPEIDRKSLKTPDAFVQKGTNWIGGLSKYQNKLFPLLVVAFLIVVAGYAFDWWQGKNLDQAWRAYHAASKEVDAKKWEALKSVMDKYGRTRAGYFASVEIADYHFEEAKKAILKDPSQVPPSLEESLKAYSKALEFSALLPSEKQLILIDRAGVYEMQKKYDEAEKDLKAASELGQELKGLALLNSARLFELKNDKSKAIETYEKIAADFLNTEYSKMARNHARRLKSPTFNN